MLFFHWQSWSQMQLAEPAQDYISACQAHTEASVMSHESLSARCLPSGLATSAAVAKTSLDIP